VARLGGSAEMGDATGGSVHHLQILHGYLSCPLHPRKQTQSPPRLKLAKGLCYRPGGRSRAARGIGWLARERGDPWRRSADRHPDSASSIRMTPSSSEQHGSRRSFELSARRSGAERRAKRKAASRHARREAVFQRSEPSMTGMRFRLPRRIGTLGQHDCEVNRA
jgi:hypothetical protein